MLGHVRNRTDTGDTVKRTMGGEEEALQTAMPRDAAPLYAVEGCSAETLQFAGTLFEKWLKYDVTTPKVSKCPYPLRAIPLLCPCPVCWRFVFRYVCVEDFRFRIKSDERLRRRRRFVACLWASSWSQHNAICKIALAVQS